MRSNIRIAAPMLYEHKQSNAKMQLNQKFLRREILSMQVASGKEEKVKAPRKFSKEMFLWASDGQIALLAGVARANGTHFRRNKSYSEFTLKRIGRAIGQSPDVVHEWLSERAEMWEQINPALLRMLQKRSPALKQFLPGATEARQKVKLWLKANNIF